MKILFQLTFISLLGLLISLEAGAQSTQNPSETFHITGSGTLYPLTKSVIDLYENYNNNVNITLEATGSSAGLKDFCTGKDSIANSSRRISEGETQKAARHGIQFYEIPVAIDGITLISHPDNTFLKDLTIEELKRIFGSSNAVTRWSDLRKEWPDDRIKIYGPDQTHGTYDYFMEKILGNNSHFRSEYASIHDYNEIVDEVSSNQNAIGYVGFDYYIQNKKKVKSIAVDNGDGPVEPTYININRGSYKPLSRTLYLYVNSKAAQHESVDKFITFYLRSAHVLTRKIGFVPYKKEFYRTVLKSYRNGNTGMLSLNKMSLTKESSYQ